MSCILEDHQKLLKLHECTWEALPQTLSVCTQTQPLTVPVAHLETLDSPQHRAANISELDALFAQRSPSTSLIAGPDGFKPVCRLTPGLTQTVSTGQTSSRSPSHSAVSDRTLLVNGEVPVKPRAPDQVPREAQRRQQTPGLACLPTTAFIPTTPLLSISHRGQCWVLAQKKKRGGGQSK